MGSGDVTFPLIFTVGIVRSVKSMPRISTDGASVTATADSGSMLPG
jgi:hypothetical protein